MKTLFLYILLVLNCDYSFANNCSSDTTKLIISGLVVDFETNKPIKNATVIISGSDSSALENKTDSIGEFNFSVSLENNYSIAIYCPQYLINFGGPIVPFGNHPFTKLFFEFKLQAIKTSWKIFPVITYGFEEYEISNPIDDPENDSLNLLIYTLTENPTLFLEVTGFRDNSESSEISLERAAYARMVIVKQGINENRIITIDGGVEPNMILRESERDHFKNGTKHNRVLTFNIISE